MPVTSDEDERPGRPPWAGVLLRLVAASLGLLALWVGCDLASAPLHMGGPMNLSYNLPLGVPLVVLGVAVVALAPGRARVAVWPLAALLSLATAGANLWHGIPVEDGAFQSLRAGVPSPSTWPAPAFLHAVALAPVGVALAALLPGAWRAGPLLLASAAATIGSGLGLEAFADALPRHGTGAWSVAGAVIAAGLLALLAMRGGHPAGRAVAGQAAVLAALCWVLWAEYTRAM
ncbi:MAG: hypothetical protein E7K72_00775 [Roseomonas mucosa]|nr:hypothetical protein [Roseomonas mucosa]